MYACVHAPALCRSFPSLVLIHSGRCFTASGRSPTPNGRFPTATGGSGQCTVYSSSSRLTATSSKRVLHSSAASEAREGSACFSFFSSCVRPDQTRIQTVCSGQLKLSYLIILFTCANENFYFLLFMRTINVPFS